MAGTTAVFNRKRKHVYFEEPSPNDKGEHSFRLKDLRDETYDANFEVFQKYLRDRGFSLSTRKAYSRAISVHIDYLIECGVYGNAEQSLATCEDIAQVITDYIHLLEKGDKTNNQKLKKIAQELSITRQSGSSYGQKQAALNHFYRLSERRARAARQRMKRLMPDLADKDDYEDVIIGINRESQFKEHEKKILRQTSMLGGVVRWHGKINRPRSLPSPKRGAAKQRRVNPFPLGDLKPLLEAASNHRDRLFWAILAIGGPRPSEVLQMRVEDINLEHREMFVPTKEEVQVSVPLRDEEKVRDKARNDKELWLLPEPFKSAVFKYLRLYMLHEYMPNSGHPFLFQYLKDDKTGNLYKRGDAFYNATGNTLLDSFRSAIRKAGIKPPNNKRNAKWNLYSLRHFYGNYLKNYFPNSEGNPEGLRDIEAQLCFAHNDIESTRVYARQEERMLKARFLTADTSVHRYDITMDNVAQFIAGKLREQADAIAPYLEKTSLRERD